MMDGGRWLSPKKRDGSFFSPSSADFKKRSCAFEIWYIEKRNVGWGWVIVEIRPKIMHVTV